MRTTWQRFTAPLPLTGEIYRRARLLVTLFYGVAVADSYQWISLSRHGYGWTSKLGLWLTGGLDPSIVQTLWQVLAVTLALSALTAAVRPSLRTARAVYSLSLLVVMALHFDGQGKIDHGSHAWWWCSFVLVFLPPFERSASDEGVKQAFVRIVWTAQLMTLLTYTAAGLSKLAWSLVGLGYHRKTWFHLGALQSHLATKLGSGASASLVAELLVRHEWVTYALQLGVLYLELFAVVGAFRYRLTRPWAVCLIGMHLGISVTMHITFAPATLALFLFVFLSPWATSAPPRDVACDLPLCGGLFRRWF